MIVDQDARPPHHLPTQSRHGCRTACHDRQAVVPPWAPLAHALAHSRGDGHQAQPEGLETIPSRSAQGWLAPTERGPEPAGEVCGGIYRPCFPGSSVPHARLRFGRHASGSNFWRGRQVRKSARGCLFSDSTTKNRCYQPSFCTVGGKGPKWSYQPCHPCSHTERCDGLL